ncbi:hypothetical protein [Emticicia sp. 21SJ11W-3]|uniref:hypothetical protein n=1 Tax=Emticicia sp. 21SJ11W-3 TaxID=2916755 RepID=UPI00209E6D81|nr:hypothetical protein [Emticicia sp. 21SJ11W-3]UTA68064.1 hypothetical protein MB380_21085 [Emticicia sp. 21SJ11W-3]
MEPVTISLIVGYLAKKLNDNKTFQDFTSDFTSATINWIRPFFLNDDGKPKEALEKLKANPESESRQKMVQAILESEIEDNPESKKYLQEMYQVIKEKESKGEAIRIINSKNVVIGDNSIQGDFVVGDNNTTGK